MDTTRPTLILEDPLRELASKILLNDKFNIWLIRWHQTNYGFLGYGKPADIRLSQLECETILGLPIHGGYYPVADLVKIVVKAILEK